MQKIIVGLCLLFAVFCISGCASTTTLEETTLQEFLETASETELEADFIRFANTLTHGSCPENFGERAKDWSYAVMKEATSPGGPQNKGWYALGIILGKHRYYASTGQEQGDLVLKIFRRNEDHPSFQIVYNALSGKVFCENLHLSQTNPEKE